MILVFLYVFIPLLARHCVVVAQIYPFFLTGGGGELLDCEVFACLRLAQLVLYAILMCLYQRGLLRIYPEFLMLTFSLDQATSPPFLARIYCQGNVILI